MVWEDLYCDKVWQFSIFLSCMVLGESYREPLLNVHIQNKYLTPIGTLFMSKWLPSLISNRSESFILVQQQ